MIFFFASLLPGDNFMCPKKIVCNIYSKDVFRRFINLMLRSVTLFSRFLLIFVLASFLKPAEVGLYGLLVATISYALMALGFDFYTYSTREIITVDSKKRLAMLRDQTVFYGITYVILLPICGLIFWYDFLPWHLAWYFYVLLALEHVAQEINRMLIAMSEPLWASVVLFVRFGLWAVVVAIMLWLAPAHRNLDFVLAAWVGGGGIACAIGVARLRHLAPGSLTCAINWAWIRRGLRVAFPFVLGTLSLRAFYTFDRYWVEALGGLEVLAAYALFIGIANAIMSFLDAAVFSFCYPVLVAAANDGDQSRFKNKLQGLFIQTLIFTAMLSVAALFLAKPVVLSLQHDVYIQYFGLLHWTILATALFALSMVPHYGLYARRQDRSIVLCHLCSLPVFFVSVFALSGPLGVLAVPIAMAVSFLFLLIFKSILFCRCWQIVAAT